MKFKVDYTIDKDIFIYLNIVWKPGNLLLDPIPAEFSLWKYKQTEFEQRIIEAQNSKVVASVFTEMLSSHFQQNISYRNTIPVLSAGVESILNANRKILFGDNVGLLEKIVGKTIQVYLTTAPKCGYDPDGKYIFLSLRDNTENHLKHCVDILRLVKDLVKNEV